MHIKCYNLTAKKNSIAPQTWLRRLTTFTDMTYERLKHK